MFFQGLQFGIALFGNPETIVNGHVGHSNSRGRFLLFLSSLAVQRPISRESIRSFGKERFTFAAFDKLSCAFFYPFEAVLYHELSVNSGYRRAQL